MIVALVDPASYAFNAFAIPPFLTALAIVLLGLIVLVRERLTPVAIAFCTVALAIGIWLFNFSVTYLARDPQVALWWARTAYFGIPLIAPAAYQFTVAVLRIYPRYKPLVWGHWLIGGAFAAAALGTDALFAGLYHYWWGYYPRFAWLGIPLVVWFVTVLIGCMAHYWRAYRHVPPGTHRQRIRALMIAFAVAYPASADYVAAYGIPLYPFGYLAILGFIILAAHAIWVYRLVDITPAFAAGAILDTMADALFVLDPDGVMRLMNRAARDLLTGHGPILGRRIDAVMDHPEYSAWLQTVMAVGELSNQEFVYQTGDGSRRIFSISASLMRDSRGQPAAVVCIAREVTASKQAQEQIASLFSALQSSHLELALAYDTTLEGWARALDLRDRETEGHSRRVTLMAEHLGRALGLNEEELRHLRQGALLHDIGKMAIPDSILLKPGTLTEDEWAIMRRHPAYAYELLAPIDFLHPALDIPYCHHEKWDGSGYPRGLAGEQIPPAARIFAVVDVWDALTSDRPYRPAWPEWKVRQHIRELAGTHFDPAVVTTFLTLADSQSGARCDLPEPVLGSTEAAVLEASA